MQEINIKKKRGLSPPLVFLLVDLVVSPNQVACVAHLNGLLEAFVDTNLNTLCQVETLCSDIVSEVLCGGIKQIPQVAFTVFLVSGVLPD